MLVVYRNFLGESHPAAGEQGVFGGRGERVDGARSESGAAREQSVRPWRASRSTGGACTTICFSVFSRGAPRYPA